MQLVADCVGTCSGGEVFVPKIPSMRVLDLAEAIAPGCPHASPASDPGRSCTRCSITADEARHTIDAGMVYIVAPEHPFWGSRGTQDGAPVPEDFHYSSDNNTEWLSSARLREVLAEWPTTAESPSEPGE